MSEAHEHAAGGAALSVATTVAARRPRQLSGRRKWLFRLFAVVVGPLLAFAILEVSLRAAGFGYSTSFFLDGSKIEERAAWIDNADFGLWLFPRKYEGRPRPVPFVIPKDKPGNTYRVFVLGESAAMGFPDPSISFARVLEAMLRASFPATQFEVVNCSMVAINSHGVLQIARQCADYQPDLFVIHLGNNEVVGPFGAAGVLAPFSPSIHVVRTNLALKRSRCGQLADELIQRISQRKQVEQQWNGMSMFLDNKLRPDDERMSIVYSNFRTNLQDIIRACRGSGAQVVLCTVPVNLRDCAPFGSLHAPELSGEQRETWEQYFNAGVRSQGEKKYLEALKSYRNAEAIDAEYAELLYRIGQCALALGENDAARAAFVKARDLDGLRFRADSRLTDISRETAAANRGDGIRLVDGTKAFARNDPTGIPGRELFLEHVHMTFKGNYLLAKEVYATITNPVLPRLEGPKAEPPAPLSEPRAAEHLGHTDWTDLKFDSEMYERLIQAPPFTYQFDHAEDCRQWEARLKGMRDRLNSGGKDEALTQYAKAVKVAKSDSMICSQFGELLFECGKQAEAEHQLRAAISHFQHAWDAQCLLGGIEMMTNRFADAEKRFRTVLRFNPRMEPAYLGLADVLDRQGKSAEALTLLEELHEDRPKSVPLVKMIGSILIRTRRYDEARPWISQGLELDPNEPDLHFDLGLIAQHQNRVDEEIDEFRTALRLKPNWPEAAETLRQAEQKRK